MIFQRLIWSALLAALCVGSVQTMLQQWQAMPLIMAAEEIEEHLRAQSNKPPSRSPMQAHRDAKSELVGEQVGHDGAASRTILTLVANVVHAFGATLWVFVVISAWVIRNNDRGGTCSCSRGLRLAAVAAVAGWVSLFLWPSLQLGASIPGLKEADLASRQHTWLIAAGCASMACALVVYTKTAWRWPTALLLLGMPLCLLGSEPEATAFASYAAHDRLSMQGLAAKFSSATLWLSVTFWAALAATCGPLFSRCIYPALVGPSGFRSGDSAEEARVLRSLKR